MWGLPTEGTAGVATMTARWSPGSIALSRYGVALPTVNAPTTVPMARPRAERNQVAIIFMAGG